MYVVIFLILITICKHSDPAPLRHIPRFTSFRKHRTKEQKTFRVGIQPFLITICKYIINLVLFFPFFLFLFCPYKGMLREHIYGTWDVSLYLYSTLFNCQFISSHTISFVSIIIYDYLLLRQFPNISNLMDFFFWINSNNAVVMNVWNFSFTLSLMAGLNSPGYF